jgi:single-strand DNA-binding protein
MNNSINRVTLIGTIASQPKLRLFDSKKAICTLSIVTLDSYFDSKTGTEKFTKDYHTIIFWGDLAKEVSTNCNENFQIFIEGRLKYSSWETKEGVKTKTCNIYADKYLLFQKTSNTTEFQYPTVESPSNISSIIEFNPSELDELPF